MSCLSFGGEYGGRLGLNEVNHLIAVIGCRSRRYTDETYNIKVSTLIRCILRPFERALKMER